MTMKRAPLFGGLVLLATLGAVGLWLVRSGRIGGKREPSNLLTLYGNVDIRQVELGFRVAGRLKSMRFEEGQAVRAGAVMAELDTRPFDDQLQRRRGAGGRAGRDPEEARRRLAAARRSLRAQATVEEATAAQQNAAHRARADARRSSRAARCRARATTTRSRASRQADARLASANESLRLLVEGSRREDIAAARAALEVAQANVRLRPDRARRRAAASRRRTAW